MALPSALSPVVVNINIQTLAGVGATGTVIFTNPYPLTNPAGDVVYGIESRTATLTAGVGSVELPSVDAPGITPTNWAYSVSVSTSAWIAQFAVQVFIANGATQAFADLTPVVTPPTVATYALLSQVPLLSTVDAKGDLYAGTADNTVARLAVGTDGKVLTAASAQASGLAWSSVPGLVPMTAGRWFGGLGTATTQVLGEGEERSSPLIMGRTCTISSMGVQITSGGTAGAVIRLVVRGDSSGMPGSVLYDSGQLDGTGIGVTTVSPNLAVTEGQKIWLSVITQGGAGTRPTLRVHGTVHNPLVGSESSAVAAPNALTGLQATAGAGTPPPSPSWFGAVNTPHVVISAAT